MAEAATAFQHALEVRQHLQSVVTALTLLQVLHFVVSTGVPNRWLLYVRPAWHVWSAGQLFGLDNLQLLVSACFQ